MTTSIKSIPSFNKSAQGVITATAKFDKASIAFSDAIAQTMQQYLDQCTVVGVARTKVGCDAIGFAIRENETMVKAWFHDGTLIRKSVTEYAQSAMRAYFHNVPFTQGLKNDPEFKIPNANGDTKGGTKGTSTGKIQNTNRAELDKTIQKMLSQARLLGLNEFAATMLDVCIESLDGFKE